MKENPVTMALLLDFYGDTLTEKQRDYFEQYHCSDLSLSEISLNEGITRQGVRDVITRTEAILQDMESRLGLVAKHGRTVEIRDKLLRAAREIYETNGRSYNNTIIRQRAEEILMLAQALDGEE
ncbi:MAG: DNA-binding protein [Oscillospiraceae bacterium]|nr:DNA-binding protein [Oscillospiraceae bacterium]